ncbi:histone-lysine N-methyltransferase SUVR5 [Dorcoceras hygrometricum]|uniref:Histone-lysine N-methyltransferase SUVR5 n=1 Tax=Dorcoceras hygrometricum TaxID=472368 RepID=A0A2Z7D1J8_9LAMI|nr:histone-lysine N-methyltransferase SUVR5 [Dorcoceras hygrometricum]
MSMIITSSDQLLPIQPSTAHYLHSMKTSEPKAQQDVLRVTSLALVPGSNRCFKNPALLGRLRPKNLKFQNRSKPGPTSHTGPKTSRAARDRPEPNPRKNRTSRHEIAGAAAGRRRHDEISRGARDARDRAHRRVLVGQRPATLRNQRHTTPRPAPLSSRHNATVVREGGAAMRDRLREAAPIDATAGHQELRRFAGDEARHLVRRGAIRSASSGASASGSVAILAASARRLTLRARGQCASSARIGARCGAAACGGRRVVQFWFSDRFRI